MAVYLMVGFLVWLHRAWTNLLALGREPLPYSPGWAVGAWLVPFLNLVRPKRMMDIVWRGSDPDRPRTDGSVGKHVPTRRRFPVGQPSIRHILLRCNAEGDWFALRSCVTESTW